MPSILCKNCNRWENVDVFTAEGIRPFVCDCDKRNPADEFKWSENKPSSKVVSFAQDGNSITLLCEDGTIWKRRVPYDMANPGKDMATQYLRIH